MQSKNRFFDDMSKLAGGAMGVLHSARDEADQLRDAGQRTLALLREESLGRELYTQPLKRRQVRAQAGALDLQRPQAERPALLEEARPALHVDAVAVDKVELQRIELRAPHLCTHGRARVGILQREEHRRPALLPLQLGQLAFNPHAWQFPEPLRDAVVERPHAKDLASVYLRRFNLRHGSSLPPSQVGPGSYRRIFAAVS